MILSGHSFFVSGSLPRYILKFLPSLLITLPLKGLCGAFGYGWNLWRTLTLHMLSSQISDRTGGKRHTLRSKQCKCVEFLVEFILLCWIGSLFLAFIFETWLFYFLYEPSCAHHFFYSFRYFWDLHCVPIFLIFLHSLAVSFWKYAREIVF
jgi:hypothetical protein